MPDLPLYLASASPRRRELLTRAGIAYTPYVVPVDEDALSADYSGPLLSLAEYLAQIKARAALEALLADGLRGRVLAADTTVLLDGRSLAKPRDADEAVAMLRALRGRTHIVATGIVLAGPGAETPPRSATAATRVTMRDYHNDELAAYVASGDPLDKAGAYSIQHPGFHPVERIEGCYLSVVGLPVCLVAALLHRAALSGASSEQPGAERGACPWSRLCVPPLPVADTLSGACAQTADRHE
jgi:septum formation protein